MTYCRHGIHPDECTYCNSPLSYLIDPDADNDEEAGRALFYEHISIQDILDDEEQFED